jgi:hypothetical protein
MDFDEEREWSEVEETDDVGGTDPCRNAHLEGLGSDGSMRLLPCR